MSNKNLFFKEDNFNLLFSILKTDIYKKFNIILNDNDNKNKKLLFETMNNIYISNQNTDLQNLNKYTLKTIAPKIKKIYDHQNNKKYKTNKNINLNLNRESVLNKKMPKFVDLRPEFHEKKNISQNIEDEFKKLNDSRYTIKKPKEIDFSLPNTDKNNVLNEYENMNQKRNLFNNKENNKSTTIDSLIQNHNNKKNNDLFDFDQQEKKINQNIQLEIEKRNHNLQQSEILFKKNMTKELNQTELNPNQNSITLSNESTLSQSDKRNQDLFNIITQSTPDETEFHKTNQKISSELKNQLNESFQNSNINQDEFLINDQHFEKALKKNYLEISSINRNWINYPDIFKTNKTSTRYNFTVNFNPAPNEWINIPIYENNIFTFINLYPNGNILEYDDENKILYKKLLNSKEKKNKINICNLKDPLFKYQEENYDHIFNDKDIIYNPFYDKKKQKGNILFFAKKKITGTSPPYVMTIYKNIYKIKLKSLIIPYDYLFTFNNRESDYCFKNKNLLKKPINHHCKNINNTPITQIYQQSLFSYPYLLIHIEELDGIYNSTSNSINKCFSKVTYLNDWTSNVFKTDINSSIPGRLPGFVMLRPDPDEEKLYPQSALANIKKLTIRILNPQGELLNVNTDNAFITQICYLPLSNGSYDKRCLIIKTKNWLPSNMFLINNIIKISLFNILIKSENPNIQLAINYLCQFINRDDGHTIMNIGYIKNNGILAHDPITIDSNHDGYFNVIFIQSNGYFDEENGIWIPTLGIDNKNGYELINTDFMNYLINPNISNYTYGKLINLNMQCDLSFEISTLESDIRKIKSNLVGL